MKAAADSWTEYSVDQLRSLPKNSVQLLSVLTAALAGVIFVLDTAIELPIAFDVLYVAVVLIAASFCQRTGILVVSACCLTLTILSHFIAPIESTPADLMNDGIGLIAIAAATYLVLKIKSAEVAMHAARAQLAHVARVTTLGELTASIAHEVNQPLAAIVTNGNASLRWLAIDPPNLSEAREAIRRIVNDGDRASKIVERARNLAKKAPLHKEPLDINDSVREIVKLTDAEIQQARISLRAQLAHDLPLVLGDPVQLQQVLLNVILNSIEAISLATAGPRELTITTSQDGGENVLVDVRDSGPGLGTTHFDHLFDAFYTTKPRGMGMGLTIARSILEAHGGRIWARPNSPRGASLLFTLPPHRGARRKNGGARRKSRAKRELARER